MNTSQAIYADNKHEESSSSLVIRVVQIKATLRYHLKTVGMAIIKNQETTNAGEDVEEKEHFWWECKLLQPLWKTVWQFLKDLEIENPFDPAIPLLSIYPKDYKPPKDTCTCMFVVVLFMIAKT